MGFSYGDETWVGNMGFSYGGWCGPEMMFGSDQRCWWRRRLVPMKVDGGGVGLKVMIVAWV